MEFDIQERTRTFTTEELEVQIPANVTAMLVFADVVGATATSPTIEGYINILDGDTQDGAFFEMKCADTDGCGN